MNRGDPSRRPQQNVLLRTALALAKRGWHVFPCAVGGKTPALPGNWQELCTTDPRRIRRWWSARRWNIGVSCGPSGLIVVDLDVPGHHKQGEESQGDVVTGADELARLCRKLNKPFPGNTFRVSTPSGGEHLYFAAESSELRNSAGRLAPMVDIRAAGGYVVAPGSQTDQGLYRVVQDEKLLVFPEWLARYLIRKPSYPLPDNTGSAVMHAGDSRDPSSALHYAEIRVATAVKGTRNDTLNRASYFMGQLVGGRLLDALLVFNTLLSAALKSGLSEAEAVATIRRGITAGRRRPRICVHPAYASW